MQDRYMLTAEGKTIARECLERSGLGSGEDVSQPSPHEEAPQVYVRQPAGREEDLPASKRPANSQTHQPCTNGGPDRTTNLDINKVGSKHFVVQQLIYVTVESSCIYILDFCSVSTI